MADAGSGEGLGIGDVAVAVVDTDQTTRSRLAMQLGQGATPFATLDELESNLGGSPTVLVLGPSYQDPAALGLVEKLLGGHREVGAILVTTDLTTDLLQQALRSGVRDVMAAPVDRMLPRVDLYVATDPELLPELRDERPVLLAPVLLELSAREMRQPAKGEDQLDHPRTSSMGARGPPAAELRQRARRRRSEGIARAPAPIAALRPPGRRVYNEVSVAVGWLPEARVPPGGLLLRCAAARARGARA